MPPRSATMNPTGSRGSTQGDPTEVETVNAVAPALKQDQSAEVADQSGATTAADILAQREPGSDDASQNVLADTERKEDLAIVPGETKADRFKRLATARTNRALTAIAGLAKLSTSSYDSTPEQQQTIMAVLRKAIDTTEAAFKPKVKGASQSFTL